MKAIEVLQISPPKTGRVSQRLEPKLEQEVMAAANRLGVKRAALVRAALEYYLNALKLQEPAPH